MKKLILALFIVLLAGCSVVSNDDIIRECNKCKQAGMKPVLITYRGAIPVRVYCKPFDNEDKTESKCLTSLPNSARK